MCSYLYDETNKKFPARDEEAIPEAGRDTSPRPSDWGLAHVGGFIFLRFFCPAIVSPKQFGIVKSM
jgi:hypothetical protein